MITLGHDVFVCLFVFLAVHKILVYVTVESVLNVIKYCIAFVIHIKLKTKQSVQETLKLLKDPQWCICCVWGHICTLIQSVQSLSRVRLFVTPWIAARQASLFITNSLSLLKLMSTELVMPSSCLILCRPLLLLPPIPPSIGVFSSESTLHMRWPKY